MFIANKILCLPNPSPSHGSIFPSFHESHDQGKAARSKPSPLPFLPHRRRRLQARSCDCRARAGGRGKGSIGKLSGHKRAPFPLPSTLALFHSWEGGRGEERKKGNIQFRAATKYPCAFDVSYMLLFLFRNIFGKRGGGQHIHFSSH